MQFRAFNFAFYTLLSFFAFSTTALTQQGEQLVLKIRGIAVEGNITSDAGTLISNSGLRLDDEIIVPGDQTSKAISRLWALKLFSDIQLVIDKQIGNDIYLVIQVKEYPRLERIEVAGNDEFDEEEIKKKVGLVKGQIVRPVDLTKIEHALKKAYEEKGYLLAMITPTLTKDTTAVNRTILSINIEEGSEVKVESIQFAGNHAFSSSDIKGAMDETSEKQWWKFWSSAKFDKKKYEKDKELIVAHYRKQGYRDAEILSDSLWYDSGKENVHIVITVHEGPQYHLRDIIWRGNTVYSHSLLTKQMGFERGETYNAAKFDENLKGNKDQTDVASLYLDNGYLGFNTRTREIRIAPDTLDVEVEISERNRFHVGQVLIKGNEKTQDRVIRRVLYTRPGDYFNRAAIIRSIRELATLNYFNPETIRPAPISVNDSTVNVEYKVEERSSDTFNASAGYSGTFGVTGALGLTFNNFNISEPFSGGAGQVLNFEWQFGEASRFRIFSLGFTEPWFLDTPTSIGFSLYDERQQYNFDLRRTGISFNLGRRFRWPDDFFRGDWFVRFQRLDVVNGGIFYRTGEDTQVSITQVISRNSLDSPIFPSQGSRFSLSTELSGGPLPGTTNYHKHDLQLDWFTPLVKIGDFNRLTLYTGARYGYIRGFTDEPYIPPIEYFFMGGNGLQVQTTPLRGYADRGIGPRERGYIRGGTVLSRYVTELRFAVAFNPVPIYLLAFAEAGNVWKDIHTTDLFDLKRSAGFGARLLIQGVGLIGFDYGYGFDDVEPLDGKADGWRFHFQFGRGF